MQYICDHIDPFTEECTCAEFYELNEENAMLNAKVGMRYSATTLAEARSFRLAHKDLDLDTEPAPLLWLGYSPEQRDWDNDELVHFDPITGAPEPFEFTEHEEDPYVPEVVNTQYKDFKPNEVTLTLDGAKPNPKAIKDPVPLDHSTVVPFPRNFRPHNFTTPLTEDHFFHHNEHITEMLHFRTYLNVFTGNYDGNLHMGSLAFTTHNDHIAVYCTTKGCRFTKDNPFKAPANPTRTEQEDFILACIRHANNHDLRSRRPAKGQFIHAINCDTNHEHYDDQRRPIGCNANNPQLHPAALDPSDFEAVTSVLHNHIKHCRTTYCKCSHYESLIWDLTHPLAVA